MAFVYQGNLDLYTFKSLTKDNTHFQVMEVLTVIFTKLRDNNLTTSNLSQKP